MTRGRTNQEHTQRTLLRNNRPFCGLQQKPSHNANTAGAKSIARKLDVGLYTFAPCAIENGISIWRNRSI
eukprot:11211667-Lingulodinium_polyedra.AAC.1